MKFFTLTTLLTSASATVLLSVAPPVLTIGKTYELEYLMDRPYNLSLSLVKKSTEPGYVWTTAKDLFKGVRGRPCNGSYVVEVDDSWPTSEDGSEYAFYISGREYKSNAGYADLTDYFNITKGSMDD